MFTFRLQGCHLLWLIFPDGFSYINIVPCPSPTTPICMHMGLGSSRFARRYSGNRFFFLFLQVLRCFSSLRLPHSCHYNTVLYYSHSIGFPHSDIPGSSLTYSYPRRFGVCSVLLRLLVPRHPPCALINLTYFSSVFFLLVFSLAFSLKNSLGKIFGSWFVY